VVFGENHLRLIIHEYVDHYHHEMNHYGLANDYEPWSDLVQTEQHAVA